MGKKKYSGKKKGGDRRDDKRGDGFKKFDGGTPSYNRKDSCNDINWYVSNENELKYVASLSFAHANGLELRAGLKDFVPSGICTVSLVPGVGVSNHEASALNIAARDIYSFVRHANSGSANYDSPDLMMYILAMDGIYSIYAHMNRAFGLLDQYSAYNRYAPKMILEALGFDFDDMIANRARYSAIFDALQKRIDVFHVPKTMPLFERHAMIFNSLYRDGDNAKSQLYAYKPQGYFVLNERTEGEPGYLEYCTIGDDVKTFYDWCQIIEQMLTPIVTSEGFQIMNGDIMKAYKDNIWSLGKFDPAHITPVVHETTVLEQMMNAVCLPLETETGADIRQDIDRNIITYRPIVEWLPIAPDAQIPVGYTDGDTLLLNSYEAECTPAMVMENTRLMPALGPIVSVGNRIAIRACSADIADHFSLWTFNPYTNSLNREGFAYFWTILADAEGATTAYDAYSIGKRCAMLGQFDYHPTCYAVVQNFEGTTEPELLVSYPICSIENFTSISHNTLEAQHNIAVFRLFGVDG